MGGYVSLYRRYRPGTFTEVVGQDHVTRTLVNALQEDRLSHAYLFTGPRGTGKTSTARILAKAINCVEGPTPEPCGVCEQCVAITDGSSVDVIELDMASHGGVDDARELRDRALFAPASARRKVYILDEVHMASTAAFNALLKLIEEPPAHVLFAMATTDPQKVLPTILSRVQRLDLRRVSALDVAAHVRHICELEGYAIDDGAVDAVVRAGDGSVRDTLSILEQVLAFAGTEVTTAAVEQTLGATSIDQVIRVVDLLAAGDLAGLLGVVQDLLDQGTDLRRFTLDLVQHVRDLLVLQAVPDRADLVDATDERRRRLQAQTTALPQATLLRMVEVLAATVAEQRQGSPRLPLELALAQLVTPGADGDLAELLDRVARLEAALAGGTGAPRVATPPVATAPVPDVVREPSVAAAPAPERAPEVVPEPGSDGAPAPEPEPEPAPAASPEAEPAPVAEPASEAQPEPEVAAEPEPASAPVPEPASEAQPEPATTAASDAESGAASVPADPLEPVDVDGVGDAAVDDPLAVVTARWDTVLELLKQGSRRHHAMTEPAVPVSLSRGILTLRYAARYGSFHAVQARGGELDAAIRDAVASTCGLRVRLEVVVEGDDERRRPLPPTVTPDDARTPVLDDGPIAGSAGSGSAPTVDAPAGGLADTAREATSVPAVEPTEGQAAAATSPDDEGAEVREAELGEVVAASDVDDLLARELGAELVDERPAAPVDEA